MDQTTGASEEQDPIGEGVAPVVEETGGSALGSTDDVAQGSMPSPPADFEKDPTYDDSDEAVNRRMDAAHERIEAHAAAPIPSTPGTHQIRINVDETGKGSGLLGIEPANIKGARTVNPTAIVTWGPAHTLGIAKIDVARATETDGTVLVIVEAK